MLPWICRWTCVTLLAKEVLIVVCEEASSDVLLTLQKGTALIHTKVFVYGHQNLTDKAIDLFSFFIQVDIFEA